MDIRIYVYTYVYNYTQVIYKLYIHVCTHTTIHVCINWNVVYSITVTTLPTISSQSILVGPVKLQFEHSGTLHIAPVAKSPMHSLVATKSRSSNVVELTPHGHGCLDSPPISVSGQ